MRGEGRSPGGVDRWERNGVGEDVQHGSSYRGQEWRRREMQGRPVADSGELCTAPKPRGEDVAWSSTTGTRTVWDCDGRSRERLGTVSSVLRGKKPCTACSDMTPPTKKQAGGGKRQGDQSSERERAKGWEGDGESTLQLYYEYEDKEEGEVTDTEEDKSKKEQEWWTNRGRDKGGRLILLFQVFFRRTRQTGRRAGGKTRRGKRKGTWQGGRLQYGLLRYCQVSR